MFDQEVSVIIQYLIIICLTLVTRYEKSFLSISLLFSSQKKDDSIYLKMIDQIKKFLFKASSKTIFPITRAPGAYSVSKPEDAYFMPCAHQSNVVTNILPDF